SCGSRRDSCRGEGCRWAGRPRRCASREGLSKGEPSWGTAAVIAPRPRVVKLGRWGWVGGAAMSGPARRSALAARRALQLVQVDSPGREGEAEIDGEAAEHQRRQGGEALRLAAGEPALQAARGRPERHAHG